MKFNPMWSEIQIRVNAKSWEVNEFEFVIGGPMWWKKKDLSQREKSTSHRERKPTYIEILIVWLK